MLANKQPLCSVNLPPCDFLFAQIIEDIDFEVVHKRFKECNRLSLESYEDYFQRISLNHYLLFPFTAVHKSIKESEAAEQEIGNKKFTTVFTHKQAAST